MGDLDRRATVFPRSKPDYRIHTPPKRALTEQELDRKPNGGSAKLRRMAPINTDGLSFSRKVFRKEAEDPWKRYRKVLQFDQAGPALLVHRNDDSFREFIVKEVKVHNKEWLSRVRDASHKNIVRLHEALYNDGAVFFFYEVMEVSLAQVFATPLGRLRHYEVAAFCFELLHGLDYIHNTLRLVHGNVNADNILLATNGIVKIGKSTRGP
jgi:serine/threonine protein kinase